MTNGLPRREKLRDIWKTICDDPDASPALTRLDQAGFGITRLKPAGISSEQRNWADNIVLLPFVTNKPASRRVFKKVRFRKYLPLVRVLRELAATIDSPFADLTFIGKREFPKPVSGTFREDLLNAAVLLEHLFSWDYCVRYLNSRNALIAELRWAIRKKTGKPHDPELSILIDVAFRAAGNKAGCYIDSTTLDRIEIRQKEGRIKAHQQIRKLIGTSV